MANAANAPKLKPWGRFKLVSKEGTEESDHIYFTHKVHKIGRNRGKVDILLDLLFISGIVSLIHFSWYFLPFTNGVLYTAALYYQLRR
jgi:hypothetical protein